MKISIGNVNGAVVVSIAGSVDALTADELMYTFTEQIGEGQRWMVADLSQVDFMSSAGLRALMNVTKDVRKQGGDLRLGGPQPGVGRILNMSGFTSIIKTYPTVEEAVTSFAVEITTGGEGGD